MLLLLPPCFWGKKMGELYLGLVFTKIKRAYRLVPEDLTKADAVPDVRI